MQEGHNESVSPAQLRLPVWLRETYVLVDYRNASPLVAPSALFADAVVLGDVEFNYFHSSASTPVYKYKQEHSGWVCKKLADFIEEQRAQILSWVFQPYPFKSVN